MDNSSITDAQILGLNIDGEVHDNSNLNFEDDGRIRKRLHLDSESSSVDIEVSSLTGFMMDKRIKLENHTEDDSTSQLMRQNSSDELGDDGGILGSSAPEGMGSSTGGMPFPSEDENGDEDGCVLIHHMDIKEPLSNLKKALEETHGICLDGYEFYLQDTTLDDFFGVTLLKNLEKFRVVLESESEEFSNVANFEEITSTDLNITCLMAGISNNCDCIYFPDSFNPSLLDVLFICSTLAGHKNLVEQCVQGCGTVQINLQLKIEDDGTKKINIIDVLKPSDSYLLATGNPAFSPDMPDEEPSQPSTKEEDPNSEQNLIRWVVDHSFKANQQKLNIPQDPMDWDVSHVRHWLLWAVRQFNLTGIKLTDWKLTGARLCNLTLEDFKTRVPYDPADIFWTHLELLRRCKFVAVMQNPEEVMPHEENEKKDKENCLDKNIMRNREKKFKSLAISVDSTHPTMPNASWGQRSGNNGQVQLWQFLLDLLTDKDHRECIQWLGAEGEFKLIEPERVAQLWGMRKNKPNMNYEKLSRALRYYYDGDMIAKVHGKRFVYKFVCDLKHLMGYSAYELNRLVIEAEMKALHASNDPIQHSIFGHREF